MHSCLANSLLLIRVCWILISMCDWMSTHLWRPLSDGRGSSCFLFALIAYNKTHALIYMILLNIYADAIATYLYLLSCYRYRFLATLIKGMRKPFQMFSWKPGGTRAGEAAHFVWRVPLDKLRQDNNKAFRLQAD